MARVRQNVSRLASGDPTLLWFERAIGAMRARPIADPRSWRFQAAIHAYTRSDDPIQSDSDVLPPVSFQEQYWTQCQHHSWFFLPWHRMYLHIFEQIVRREIVNMGGPGDWALPYWNYSASPEDALLPDAFRRAVKSDGTVNHLYIQWRGANVNEGEEFSDAGHTDLTKCLAEPRFEGVRGGGSHGFGGVATPFQHRGAYVGELENAPHGMMHARVAGATGWMGRNTRAPLDPIFWLHHCNIDRLWEVWLRRSPLHANPTSIAWLDAVAFDFIDWKMDPIKMTPRQVLDTRAAPLDYEYQDTSDPLDAAPIPTSGLTLAHLPARTGSGMSELIGATSASFWLRGSRVEQTVKILRPTGPAADSFWLFDSLGVIPPRAHRPRVFVCVEAVKSDQWTDSYDVYLNLPSGSNPTNHEELRAGRLSMFGLVEASQADSRHIGQGLWYSFDVTEIIATIVRRPGWTAGELRVTLAPTRWAESELVFAEVGRISIYLE